MSTDDLVNGNGSGDPIDHLRPNQLRALEVLLSGGTVNEAAATADVHRTRVSDWKHNDPYFQAAFNREKHRIVEEGRQRLLNLIGPAIGNLERSIKDEGDVRDSRWLLERLGTAAPEPDALGSGNPDMIRLQQQVRDWMWERLLEVAFGDDEAAKARLFEVAEGHLIESDRSDSEAREMAELEAKIRKMIEGSSPDA